MSDKFKVCVLDNSTIDVPLNVFIRALEATIGKEVVVDFRDYHDNRCIDSYDLYIQVGKLGETLTEREYNRLKALINRNAPVLYLSNNGPSARGGEFMAQVVDKSDLLSVSLPFNLYTDTKNLRPGMRKYDRVIEIGHNLFDIDPEQVKRVLNHLKIPYGAEVTTVSTDESAVTYHPLTFEAIPKSGNIYKRNKKERDDDELLLLLG